MTLLTETQTKMGSQVADDLVKFVTFGGYCASAVALLYFYFFIANRLFGWFLSLILGPICERMYRCRISFDSVKISLLSGHLLLRNFRYQSINESVYALQLSITIHYYDLRPKDGRRISVYANGLEWFVYNRMPAYEFLEAQIKQMQQENTKSTTAADTVKERKIEVEDWPAGGKTERKPTLWERYLPVELELGKGAITVGNNQLPTLLIMDFKSARGVYKTSPSRSQYDLYKTTLQLVFERTRFQMRDNLEYTGGEADASFAQTLPSDVDRVGRLKRIWMNLTSCFQRCRRVKRRSSEDSDTTADRKWKGLNRYRMSAIRGRFDDSEYAKVTTILECKQLDLTYYTDDPGILTGKELRLPTDDKFQSANGGLPPEWGYDLKFMHTTINYGPWADKQRTCIQEYFFPFAYHTFPTTPLPQPGDRRMFTQLNFYIELLGETSWRIPTKEPSKDHIFVNQATDKSKKPNGTKKTSRPHGWLDFKIGGGKTTINLLSGMIMRENGYSTKIDVKTFSKMQVISSVNHADFLTTDKFEASFDMASPRHVHDTRPWDISIRMEKPVFFLLKDHITLCQDLIADWNDRSAIKLEQFLAYDYFIKFIMSEVRFLFCVNERNIISQPNDLDENSFLIMDAPRVIVDTHLPYLTFDELETRNYFIIEITRSELSVSHPACSTFASFLDQPSRKGGALDDIVIEGTYEYRIRKEGIIPLDNLSLHLCASRFQLYWTGFVIRSLFLLKQNFFGDFINFTTLDEFKSKAETTAAPSDNGAPLAALYEICFTVNFGNVEFVFPENLYSTSNVSRMFIEEIQMDSRNADDFGDFQINFSPIRWKRYEGKTVSELDIDRFILRAHQLYGTPPKYMTYLSEAEIFVGDVVGQLTDESFRGFTDWFECFKICFSDYDNDIKSAAERINKGSIELSVMFARFDVESVQLQMRSASSDELLTLLSMRSGIHALYDSYIDEQYENQWKFGVPDIEVSILNRISQSDDLWVEIGYARTVFYGCQLQQYPDWEQRMQEQQQFLRQQDRYSRRCCFLYETAETDSSITGNLHDHSPFEMPFFVPKVEARLAIFYGIEEPFNPPQNHFPWERKTPLDSGNDDEEDYRIVSSLENDGAKSFKRLLRRFFRISPAAAKTAQDFFPHESKSYRKLWLPDFRICRNADLYSWEQLDLIPPPSDTINYRFDFSACSEDEAEISMALSYLNITVPSLKFFGCPLIFELIFSYYDVEFNLKTFKSDNERIVDRLQRLFMTSIAPQIFPEAPLMNSEINIESVILTLMQPDYSVAYNRAAPQLRLVNAIAKKNQLISDASGSFKLRSESMHIDIVELESAGAVFNQDYGLLSVDCRILLNQLEFSTLHRNTDFFCAVGEVYFRPNLVDMTVELFYQLSTQIADIKFTILNSHSLLNRKMQRIVAALVEYSKRNECGEPSFLSRPSNLWRFGVRDYQNTDDWKILMHIRQCFSKFKQEPNFADLLDSMELDVTNMKKMALGAFKEWRSWDLGDLEQCELLNNLFSDQPFIVKNPDGQDKAASKVKIGKFRINGVGSNDSFLIMEDFQYESAAHAASVVVAKQIVEPALPSEETQPQSVNVSPGVPVVTKLLAKLVFINVSDSGLATFLEIFMRYRPSKSFQSASAVERNQLFALISRFELKYFTSLLHYHLHSDNLIYSNQQQVIVAPSAESPSKSSVGQQQRCSFDSQWLQWKHLIVGGRLPNGGDSSFDLNIFGARFLQSDENTQLVHAQKIQVVMGKRLLRQLAYWEEFLRSDYGPFKPALAQYRAISGLLNTYNNPDNSTTTIPLMNRRLTISINHIAVDLKALSTISFSYNASELALQFASKLSDTQNLNNLISNCSVKLSHQEFGLTQMLPKVSHASVSIPSISTFTVYESHNRRFSIDCKLGLISGRWNNDWLDRLLRSKQRLSNDLDEIVDWLVYINQRPDYSDSDTVDFSANSGGALKNRYRLAFELEGLNIRLDDGAGNSLQLESTGWSYMISNSADPSLQANSWNLDATMLRLCFFGKQNQGDAVKLAELNSKIRLAFAGIQSNATTPPLQLRLDRIVGMASPHFVYQLSAFLDFYRRLWRFKLKRELATVAPVNTTTKQLFCDFKSKLRSKSLMAQESQKSIRIGKASLAILLPPSRNSATNAALLLNVDACEFLVRDLGTGGRLREISAQIVNGFDSQMAEQFSPSFHKCVTELRVPILRLNMSGYSEISLYIPEYSLTIYENIWLLYHFLAADFESGSPGMADSGDVDPLDLADDKADGAVSIANWKLRIGAGQMAVHTTANSGGQRAKLMVAPQPSNAVSAATRSTLPGEVQQQQTGQTSTAATNEADVYRSTLPRVIIVAEVQTEMKSTSLQSQSFVMFKAQVDKFSHSIPASILTFIRPLFSASKTVGETQSESQSGTRYSGTVSVIDGSLILSCAPHSKVETIFNLENAVFLLNTDDDYSGATGFGWKMIGGTAEKLTARVRHEFAPGNCVHFEFERLHFSMANQLRGVAVLEKTFQVNIHEISGAHNFRYLSDLLAFNSGWVEPLLNLLNPVDSLASGENQTARNESTANTHLILKVAKFELAADFTQAIGTVKLNAQNVKHRLSLRPRKSRLASLSADVAELKSEGRLQGIVLGVVNLRALYSSTAPEISTTSQIEKGGLPLNTMQLSMDRALTHLEFNNERIVVLNIEPVQFSLADFWPAEALTGAMTAEQPGAAEIQININLLLSQVNGILSKNSVPYIMRLTGKFKSLVAEKLQQSSVGKSLAGARPTEASPSGNQTAVHPANQLLIGSLSNSNSLTANGLLQLADRSLLPACVTATIRVTDVRLALFKEQFDPGQDCIQLRIGDFQLDYMRTFTDSNTRRELRLNLSGSQPMSIRKCVKRDKGSGQPTAGGSLSNSAAGTAISPSSGSSSSSSAAAAAAATAVDDFTKWSIMQWLDHVAGRSFKLILALPPSDILMESLEPATGLAGGLSVIEYMFESRFKGAIDINLNIGFIKFLQDTASDFGEQFSAALQQTLQPPKPGKQVAQLPQQTPTVYPVSSSVAGQSAVWITDSVEYRPLKPIMFEPQLKAIDGATPADVLKWLGVQKETLPATVHSSITMGVEELITTHLLHSYVRYCFPPPTDRQ